MHILFHLLDQIAIEIAEDKLGRKGSRRDKIYFLLNAFVHDFDIDLCVKLSGTRNEIAHGEQTVKPGHLELCKKMAFWASEVFVLHIAETAYKKRYRKMAILNLRALMPLCMRWGIA